MKRVLSVCTQIEKSQKYAKWKAAYIHKCLKNGETPVPGPLPEHEEEFGFGPLGRYKLALKNW